MYQLKSKVITYFDGKTIDLHSVIAPFAPDDGQARQALLRVQKQHGVMQAGQWVEEGDFVTLRCGSSVAKFNKAAIPVTVGKGAFSRELEQQLIGLQSGETARLQVDGQAVEVTVLEIKRRVLPALTDETVKSWAMAGVDSVETLRQSIHNAQKQAWLEDMTPALAVWLSTQECGKSTFLLDEQELETAKAQSFRMAQDMLRSAGLDPETASDEEVTAVCGQSKAEHFAKLEELGISGVQSSAIGAMLMERQGISLGEADYEAELLDRAREFGTDPETDRKTFTPENFIMQQTANYHYDLLENYARQYLEKENGL